MATSRLGRAHIAFSNAALTGIVASPSGVGCPQFQGAGTGRACDEFGDPMITEMSGRAAHSTRAGYANISRA